MDNVNPLTESVKLALAVAKSADEHLIWAFLEPVAPQHDYVLERVNEVSPDHTIDLAPAASAEDIEALRNEVTTLREFLEKSRVAPASSEIPKIDAGATSEIPKSDDQAGAPPRPTRRDVADRVRDVHNLLKDGKTTPTAAFQKIGTDKKTYRRYCEGVTGEKPLG
jgi:hypothetical protein